MTSDIEDETAVIATAAASAIAFNVQVRTHIRKKRKKYG